MYHYYNDFITYKVIIIRLLRFPPIFTTTEVGTNITVPNMMMIRIIYEGINLVNVYDTRVCFTRE